MTVNEVQNILNRKSYSLHDIYHNICQYVNNVVRNIHPKTGEIQVSVLKNADINWIINQKYYGEKKNEFNKTYRKIENVFSVGNPLNPHVIREQNTVVQNVVKNILEVILDEIKTVKPIEYQNISEIYVLNVLETWVANAKTAEMRIFEFWKHIIKTMIKKLRPNLSRRDSMKLNGKYSAPTVIKLNIGWSVKING